MWTLLHLLACGDTSAATDQVADTDTGSTSSPSDSPSPTPTADTADTGPTTISVPLPGWGTITGDCGVLDDDEWTASSSFRFRNTLDLTGLTWAGEDTPLSEGALRILEDGTLGGSSESSEALAYDVLDRCELAALLDTERSIRYADADGRKTDLRAEIDEREVGVSVTRAMTFVSPEQRCGTPGDTLATLVAEKVAELQESEANQSPKTPWERSLLSIIACDDAHATVVEDTWEGLDAAVRSNAILVLTVLEGNDAFAFE